MRKPKIAYIGEEDSFDETPDYKKEALIHVLERDVGISVESYDNLSNFEDKINKELVIGNYLLIIAHELRLQGNEEFLLKLSRKTNSSLPIIIYKEEYEELRKPKEEYPYSNLTIWEKDSKSLVELIKSKEKVFSNNERKNAVSEEILLLENIYNNHYSGENENERVFGVSDRNGKIVAEYLRCRQLGGAVIEEFDKFLPKQEKIKRADSTLYLQDLVKLRNMDEKEKEGLKNKLYNNIGHISCGPNVHGYAIDPETLAEMETTGFGNHNVAKMLLEYKVGEIEHLRTNEWPDEDEIRWRLINGFVHKKIKGFNVPLVELILEGEYFFNMLKVSSHIIKEQKYLPVDFNGNLLEFEN